MLLLPLSEKPLWFYSLKVTKCYSYERRDRRPPETCASPGAITHMHMRRLPSCAGPETVSRATDGVFYGFISSFLSRVWLESVKSPSKNVCGGDGDDDAVDAGDVFRSRPEQILQIIRTWRRFPGKSELFFFLQAADSRDHPSTQAWFALRCALCICFDSPLHNFSAP